MWTKRLTWEKNGSNDVENREKDICLPTTVSDKKKSRERYGREHPSPPTANKSTHGSYCYNRIF